MARRKTLTDNMILKLKPARKRLTMPDPELRGHYIRVTPTHTTDALLLDTIDVTHTTDALLKDTIGITHTTDALLKDQGFSVGLRLMYRLFRMLLKSPAMGAATSVYLATSPEGDNVSGEYFVDKKIKPSAPKTYDLKLQRQLWDLSLRLTKLRPEETPIVLE